MNVQIREATPADAVTIERIESDADALLVERFAATDWPPPTPADERLRAPGFILVASISDGESGSTIVGFVHVRELDGHAHLEQLSVSPAYGRRGIGRSLVHAALDRARDRGHGAITLRTYVDVPWNAPFYASCGFAVSLPSTAALRRLVGVEERLGLGAYGARVQMTAVL